MTYLVRTLKTKGCPAPGRAARRIHGQVRAYLEDHPDEAAALSVYLDKAPRGWPAAHYVSYARSRIQECRQAHRKAEDQARTPKRIGRPGPVPIGELMGSAMDALG